MRRIQIQHAADPEVTTARQVGVQEVLRQIRAPRGLQVGGLRVIETDDEDMNPAACVR